MTNSECCNCCMTEQRNKTFLANRPRQQNVWFWISSQYHEQGKRGKRGKAAGRDRIKAEFLKAAPRATRELLLKLLNLIFRTNVVPKSWCIGILNLIHKEGSKDDPDNYRGICIGSVLSKTLSTMMNVRLTKFVSERDILHKEQIGFTENNCAPDHPHHQSNHKQVCWRFSGVTARMHSLMWGWQMLMLPANKTAPLNQYSRNTKQRRSAPTTAEWWKWSMAHLHH